MDGEEFPVFCGYLLTQTGFSLNRISKKKSTNPKYCLLFKASRHGIERLEICDNKDDKNPKIITLENCVKITQDQTTNLINIVTKTGTLTLNTQSDDDLIKWVTVLKSVAFKDKNNTLGRNNNIIEEDNDLYCSSYNDGLFNVKLISSETTIRCNLEPTTYLLSLAVTELQLKNIKTEKIVSKWPYRYIRKYGYRDGKFTFEAGRKCDTGEGIFSLDNINPQEIFRCMSAKMKTMKKMIKSGSTVSLDCGETQFNAALSMEAGSRSPLPPSPNFNISSEFDMNILNNTSISSTSSSLLNQSCASIRGFISSNDSLNNIITTTTTNNNNNNNSNNNSNNNNNNNNNNNSNNSNKHNIIIPNKPPRKILGVIDLIKPSTEKYRKFQNYDPVSTVTVTTQSGNCSSSSSSSNNNNNSNNANIIRPNSPHSNKCDSNKNLTLIIPNEPSNKSPELPTRNPPINRDYECIENITEAWKTLGIDEVKHTEHVTTPEDELVEFIWQRSRSQTTDKPSNNNIDKEKLTLSTTTTSSSSSTTTISATTPTQSTKTILNEINDDNNYDRLEFFGSTSKKNSSYKTIITVVPQSLKKQMSQPITSNDYELIGSVIQQPDIQSCRLADDSYLGYGMIRKPSLPGPQSLNRTVILTDDDLLDHRQCNGLDYAIVSKPKRV